MNGIAKIDALLGFPPAEQLARHPAVPMWTHPLHGLLPRIQACMQLQGAHPARTVVVLPFAQLLPLATRLWVQCYPEGFAPRFETTLNWSTAEGGVAVSDTDIRFDMALDMLTAQALLVQAGLGTQQDTLAGLLVQAAQQLAPLAAACNPKDRAQWTLQARIHAVVGMEGAALAWETAVARVAVEWAAVSAYASDVLYSEQVRDGVDCLIMVQGLALDPLAAGLQTCWGDKFNLLQMLTEGAALAPDIRDAPIALHPCLDAEDEAQRCAASVLQHIEAGRFPLALVSSDRSLTRRVRAMLEGLGIQIRDENGWKLSTSLVAAQLMALLRACAWNASTDRVLDWVKTAPAFARVCDALEAHVRRDQVRDWRKVAQSAVLAQINAIRDGLGGRKTLVQWLDALRGALRASGQWDGLLADGAGVKMVEVLRLSDPAPQAWAELTGNALWAGRRMDLAEFTAWVNQALEGASYSPVYPDQEQVVIVPMSQTLARPFAAMVLAGCDEVRLNPSPEPSGGWTAQQRAALGLPARAVLETALRAAWTQALQTPFCDVFWRKSDDAGEDVLPSSLVQLLQLQPGLCVQAHDPRAQRKLLLTPLSAPMPRGDLLPVRTLSASGFEDLRTCPYRFFAMRQLGLKTVDELDGEVGKRDFGLWLHEVLKRFHEALVQNPTKELPARCQMMDDASNATTQSMAMAEGEFLPFAAAWPAVRDGYLHWLVGHEATGAVFAQAEVACAQRIGAVQLIGRIDRMDTLPDGSRWVLDYKTEPVAKTQSRVKTPLEDTQIAFYAALLPDDTLHGAYTNVGERDGTRTFDQPHIVSARDALIEGLLHDLDRIAQGDAMPALGDGVACDFCKARGLCRKDFWSAT